MNDRKSTDHFADLLEDVVRLDKYTKALELRITALENKQIESHNQTVTADPIPKL